MWGINYKKQLPTNSIFVQLKQGCIPTNSLPSSGLNTLPTTGSTHLKLKSDLNNYVHDQNYAPVLLFFSLLSFKAALA